MGPLTFVLPVKPRSNFSPAQISLMVLFAAEFTDQWPAGYFKRFAFFKEKESLMSVTKSGKDLVRVIEKAIEDSVITFPEYEEIMSVASQDSVIDAHEKALLKELNSLIANKTITFGKSP